MTPFDTVAMADWSARSTPSPARPTADAIWIAVSRGSGEEVAYHRTRAAGEAALADLLSRERAAGRRVLLGFDLAFGYPAGFAAALTGEPRAQAVWAWLAAHLSDSPDNANDRFEIADAINARLPGVGPFWGRPAGCHLPHLPARGSDRRGHPFPDRRAAEEALPRAQSVWKLYTTGAVGSQVLVALPMLHRLAARFGRDLAVWPFDPPEAPIVLAETYFSLIDPAIAGRGGIKDALQVRLMARAVRAMQAQGRLSRLFEVPGDPRIAEEGWVLGTGFGPDLCQALPGGGA